jgi:hypothetical protein
MFGVSGKFPKWPVIRGQMIRGQTGSLSEIDLTQPTINDLQAIAG